MDHDRCFILIDGDGDGVDAVRVVFFVFMFVFILFVVLALALDFTVTESLKELDLGLVGAVMWPSTRISMVEVFKYVRQIRVTGNWDQAGNLLGHLRLSTN
jgi:hypothetical protein